MFDQLFSKKGILLSLSITMFATAGSAVAADKVTFVTDFGYLGRHAYYFVALDKGYYKEAGLDVEIVRGQGSTDAVKQVAAGAAQIGFADAASVILARANDQVPVKLVSMIYADPPHSIFTLEGSGINEPKDLEGRTIADSASSSLPKLFPAYAKAAKIDAEKVNWAFVSSDAIAATLALGHADAVTYYSISEALLQKSVGSRKLVRLTFAEAGMDFYSNGIISNDEFIESNPDVVRRFVKATLRALDDAINNPEEAAEILHKRHRQIEVDVGTAEMKVVASLAQARPEPVGALNPERLQQTIDLVEGAFEMQNPVTVSDVYAPGFTESD